MLTVSVWGQPVFLKKDMNRADILGKVAWYYTENEALGYADVLKDSSGWQFLKKDYLPAVPS